MSLSRQLEEAVAKYGTWEMTGDAMKGTQAYSIQTPVGIAHLTKNAKGKWQVELNGKTKPVGAKKPEFGHAEALVIELVNATPLKQSWKDGEYARYLGTPQGVGVIVVKGGTVSWVRLEKANGKLQRRPGGSAIDASTEGYYEKMTPEAAAREAQQAYLRVGGLGNM